MIRPETIGSLIIGLVSLGYGVYCMVHGGTHTRNATWFTREEAPKPIWRCMGSVSYTHLTLPPILLV